MQAIERIRAALRNIDSAIHEGAREDAYFELEDACNPAAMSEVLAHIDALTAENERLTECLKKANAQAEHFEREWYLRGDEVERLSKDAESWQQLQRDRTKQYAELLAEINKGTP